MRHLGLLSAFWLMICCSVSASVTEIRQNFFNQVVNLPAINIMAPPTGDASYLISVYESTVSCSILPTLRWIDENGSSRSQVGIVGPPSVELPSGNCYVSLLATLRVHANTTPTVETTGDNNRFNYSLYVSGLGFWSSGAQGQGGLTKVTGALPVALVHSLSVYKPPVSTSALIVAYSTGYARCRCHAFLSWGPDENGNSLFAGARQSICTIVSCCGSPGGTKVWIHTSPGDTTWYALIVFGEPGPGSGSLGDYEEELLNWTSATYPNWQPPFFTAGSTGSNVLLMSNLAQPASAGPVGEGLQVDWTNQTSVPCAAALVANSSGIPASAVFHGGLRCRQGPLRLQDLPTPRDLRPGSPPGLTSRRSPACSPWRSLYWQGAGPPYPALCLHGKRRLP